MLESWIREVTFAISLVVEAAAALLVAYAVLEALVRLLFSVRRHSGDANPAVAHDAKEEIRLRLGRWLALSLELLLGADILRTAVAPSWEEIGKLAAIATIRTALNFFLQREIDAAERRRLIQSGDHGLSDGTGSGADRTRS